MYSRRSSSSILLWFFWFVGGCRSSSLFGSYTGGSPGTSPEWWTSAWPRVPWWSLATQRVDRCLFNKAQVRLLLLAGVDPASLLISSRCPCLWKGPLFLFLELDATMEVEKELRRGSEMVLAEGVRAHQQRLRSGGATAPVSADELLLLQAERRPSLFLLALMPYRRQLLCSFGGHGQLRRLWRFRRRGSIQGDAA